MTLFQKLMKRDDPIAKSQRSIMDAIKKAGGLSKIVTTSEPELDAVHSLMKAALRRPITSVAPWQVKNLPIGTKLR
jgi:hypothetical protein